jgi:hypothetical protein
MKTLNFFTVERGEKVLLANDTFYINGTITIEPKGNLIIKNAVLIFSRGSGIRGKDCIFLAENSKFTPQQESWLNITLIGNTEGHIRNCLLRGCRGIKEGYIYFFKYPWKFKSNIYEMDPKDRKKLNSPISYGGGMYIESKKEFLVSNTQFENCFAHIGGGIYINSDKVIVENCNFLNCHASLGGGVFINESTILKFCNFVNCSAQEGGAINISSNSFKNILENCNFTNCSAEINGGAVWISAHLNIGSDNIINKCNFSKCSALKKGGAIYKENTGSYYIKSCYFEDCSATEGGAIYISKDNKVENCKFVNCSATDGGGALSNNSNFLNCQFENCSATRGGGVFAGKFNTLEKCIFQKCSSNLGGGVYSATKNNIINCTFTNCSASDGGGIFCEEKIGFLKSKIYNNQFSDNKPNNIGGDCEIYENLPEGNEQQKSITSKVWNFMERFL